MKCLLQAGMTRKSFLSGDLQRGLRGYLLAGHECHIPRRGNLLVLQEICSMSMAVVSRLPWTTPLSQLNESFTQEYEIPPATGSSSLV
jgi:hypothetical protein